MTNYSPDKELDIFVPTLPYLTLPYLFVFLLVPIEGKKISNDQKLIQSE